MSRRQPPPLPLRRPRPLGKHESALTRVRGMVERDRFEPTRPPTWRGSSRDLVVNRGRRLSRNPEYEPEPEQIERMYAAYVRTALWSTNDESDESGGVPLDENYDGRDLARDTRDKMYDDVEKFARENAELISGDWEQAGHDFWLTRNGHGAGFWDGDWPEPSATALTEAAHDFGEVSLYIGDDGRIYGG